MKLDRMTLANFRGFDQIDLQFEKDVTVIAGVNGVGKSAILDAVTKAVSLALPRISPSKEKTIGLADTDIKDGKDSLSLSVVLNSLKANIHVDIARSAGVSVMQAEELTKRRDELRFATRETRKGSKEEQEIEDEIHRIDLRLSPTEDVPTLRILPIEPDGSPDEIVAALKTGTSQPVAVYYSTFRLLSRLPPSLHKTKPIEIATAYNKALDQLEVSLNDFANWYRVLAEGDQPKRSTRMFEQLEAATSTFLPGVSNLHLHSERPPRFSVQKNGSLFYLEQLSDGERGLLAIVFDLTRRLAIANLESKNPIADGVGLVMIDEIELHLHPSWQRHVLRKLRDVFKNCQFVITTHSPLVLGEALARCVRFLEFQGGKVIATIPAEAYGMDANRILQELMGAPIRNKTIDAKLRVLFELIDKEDLDQARSKISELEKHLGESEPELTRASSLITFLEGLA
jgi:predicted ATP-binding protein involved in virulence